MLAVTTVYVISQSISDQKIALVKNVSPLSFTRVLSMESQVLLPASKFNPAKHCSCVELKQSDCLHLYGTTLY